VEQYLHSLNNFYEVLPNQTFQSLLAARTAVCWEDFRVEEGFRKQVLSKKRIGWETEIDCVDQVTEMTAVTKLVKTFPAIEESGKVQNLVLKSLPMTLFCA
jgi:hypothetical protein